MLHPNSTCPESSLVLQKKILWDALDAKSSILLIPFQRFRFVVDDCSCDPHVQNGHDDKPNENWRKKEKIKMTSQASNQHFISVHIPSGSSYWPWVSPVVMTVVKIRADKQSKHSISEWQTREVLSFPFVSLTQACIRGQSPGESADLPRVLWAPETLKLCHLTAGTNESAQALKDNGQKSKVLHIARML